MKLPFVVPREFGVLAEEVGNNLKGCGVVRKLIRRNIIPSWFDQIVVGFFDSDT